MSYKTTIRKSHSIGWCAETYIQLAEPKRQLKVSTYKRSRGVATSCQAVEKGDMFESYVVHGDYSKTIQQYPAINRVTDKVILQAHATSLQGIELIVEEANNFYKEKQGELMVGLTG